MIPSKWVIDRIAGDANSFFSKTAGLVGLSLLHEGKQGYRVRVLSCRFPLFHPLFLTSKFKHLTNRLNRKVVAVFLWILMQVRTPYYICTTTSTTEYYDGNSDLHLDPLISVQCAPTSAYSVRSTFALAKLVNFQKVRALGQEYSCCLFLHEPYRPEEE